MCCRYWPRFVRLSIVLATVAEHIAPERQKDLPAELTPSSSFFGSLQHVRTDREPISHYNGCSQDSETYVSGSIRIEKSSARLERRRDRVKKSRGREAEGGEEEKVGGRSEKQVCTLCLAVDGTVMHGEENKPFTRVSDAISKIANKTDAASAYRGRCVPARGCKRVLRACVQNERKTNTYARNNAPTIDGRITDWVAISVSARAIPAAMNFFVECAGVFFFFQLRQRSPLFDEN